MGSARRFASGRDAPGTPIAKVRPMASLATKSSFLALFLASHCFAVSAWAQQTVPKAPSVSTNSNSEAAVESSNESEPADESEPATAPRAVVAAMPGVAVFALFPFSVRARNPGRRLEIRSTYDVTIARCIGSCRLDLPHGDYKAIFYDAAEHEHVFEFSVDGPGGFEIDDADEGTAKVGLGMGIAGVALVITGTALLTAGLSNACLMSECENRDNSGGALFAGGLLVFAAGAAITPVGWVMWARNRHPRLLERSADMHVVVAPTQAGAFLGVTGHF